MSFNTVTKTPTGMGQNPDSMAIGDFNGDGKLDLVTANQGSDNVSILLGDGTGSFSFAMNFEVGKNPYAVAVGDFNHDGNVDLATANGGFVPNSKPRNTVSVLLGDGTGNFSRSTPDLTVETGAENVGVGDFDKNGNLDIVSVNHDSNNVSLLLGDGMGGFGAAKNFPTAGHRAGAVVGDFNGDGNLDLAMGGHSARVSVLFGDGAGNFGSLQQFGEAGFPSIAGGDFNADGKSDLVVGNFAQKSISVLLGDETGSFTTATGSPLKLTSDPTSVVVGDFDSDGKQDIAAIGSDKTISVLLGNGTGGFSPPMKFELASSAESPVVGDFNGDNKPDIAIVDSESGSISVLLTTIQPGETIQGTRFNDNDSVNGDGQFHAALRGTPGDDLIDGGLGADILDGAGGNDTLVGGGGVFNDIYIVDSPGDKIVDSPKTGIETVISSVDWDLRVSYKPSDPSQLNDPGVEGLDNLTLTGSDSINGTGNKLGNVIKGNDARNTLDGMGGNDTLYGFGDDDTLIGGFGNDSLVGGDGNDFLNGYGTTVTNDSQFDTLIGGAGTDTFVLGDTENVFYVESGDGYATIKNWDSTSDRIQLHGSPNQYKLDKVRSVVGSSATDTEIYLLRPGQGAERIGVVQDTTKVNLNQHFVFV